MSKMADIENEEYLYPCTIYERGANDTTYTISRHLPEQTVVLTNYPSESITFRTKKYASDQHLKDAARHFIEIEDTLFPDQWKTLR